MGKKIFLNKEPSHEIKCVDCKLLKGWFWDSRVIDGDFVCVKCGRNRLSKLRK